MLSKRYLLLISFLCFEVLQGFAQFVAHAGNDKTVCPGASAVIGGSPTASGGLPPYTYSWSPTTGLAGSTTANPTCTPPGTINYTVTVTDDTGAVRNDVVTIFINIISYVSAGRDTSICVNSSASIGSSSNLSGINYSWSPGATLNDSSSPTPVSSPHATTTTYTLTASIAGCAPKTDRVTVTVIPTPLINAGNDTTIFEGAVATLQASGGYNYFWSPTPTLTYWSTARPNAEPVVTTTYGLYGTDESNKCPSYDFVTVTVEPSDEVVIYNTFTPNGDGNNDTWYIGNIWKYPDSRLEVYNRYGKLVYKTSGYQNNWDGRVSGEELPAATYFFDLDLGLGRKHHGTVTIIK